MLFKSRLASLFWSPFLPSSFCILQWKERQRHLCHAVVLGRQSLNTHVRVMSASLSCWKETCLGASGCLPYCMSFSWAVFILICFGDLMHLIGHLKHPESFLGTILHKESISESFLERLRFADVRNIFGQCCTSPGRKSCLHDCLYNNINKEKKQAFTECLLCKWVGTLKRYCLSFR